MTGVSKKNWSSTYREINRMVGQAIHRYDMIETGDRIAVGVSGGKDSLALIWALAERQKRVPVRYDLFAVHVDPGFGGGCSDALATYCTENGYSLRTVSTDIGVRAHSLENRENPCFFCARLRRKLLFDFAAEMGCNKIALGHHRDDIIETFFLNMFYAGEMGTMLPKQSLFSGRVSIIRPFAFVDEDLIRRFGREQDFPQWANPCPSAKNSKRYEIKTVLNQLYQGNDKAKGNVFRALSHAKMGYLLK